MNFTLRRYLIPICLGIYLQAGNLAYSGERVYFNDLKVPSTLVDVLAIESALKQNLSQARAATISISDGAGFGSGVIVSSDGLVMTAAHVIAGVNRDLTVTMEDGTEYKAISLGLDSGSDAGLLQILDQKNLPYVEVERKDKQSMSTKLGDWVFALGHSGGFDVKRGSVVRLGRVVRLNDSPATIQSDCKLIGGDSGGPLFNMNGILVGIHSRVGKVLDQNMHVASYDFFSKVGDTSKWDKMLNSEFLGNQIFAKKPVLGEGFMGFAVTELEDELKISDIDKASPVGKAGLKIGDILDSLNGEKVSSAEDIRLFMQKKAEGDKVEITVYRKGEVILLKIILTKR